MNGQAADLGGRELEGADEQINVEAAALAGGHWAAPAGAVPPPTPSLGGRTGLATGREAARGSPALAQGDRKSTRLNSSHT